jgi:aldehyde dehydrogenase (NAD+)
MSPSTTGGLLPSLINGAQNLAVHRPFGGFGISGVGKEGGRAGFEEFLRVKSIAIAVH